MNENIHAPQTLGRRRPGKSRRRWIVKSDCVLVAGVGVIAGFSALLYTALADAPVLSIQHLGTNQLSITISDAVATNFTLEWRPVLGGTNYEWVALWGIEGTNTTVNAGTAPSGWFRVKEGIDGDGDGIPPWIDGNDNDPDVGALMVTIDSPLDGENLN